MNVRNLLEITVDMKNKDLEIIQIVSLYVKHIDNLNDRRTFLLRLSEGIHDAIVSIDQRLQDEQE